jgi:hypothetical protein
MLLTSVLISFNLNWLALKLIENILKYYFKSYHPSKKKLLIIILLKIFFILK